MSNLKIKKLADVLDNEQCSADPSYTLEGLCSMVAAHNAGAIDIEEQVWFGHRDDYRFAPKSAYVLVREG